MSIEEQKERSEIIKMYMEKIKKNKEWLMIQPNKMYATSQRFTKLSLDRRLNTASKCEVVELLGDCASHFKSCCDQTTFFEQWIDCDEIQVIGELASKALRYYNLYFLLAVLAYAKNSNYPKFVIDEIDKIIEDVEREGLVDAID